MDILVGLFDPAAYGLNPFGLPVAFSAMAILLAGGSAVLRERESRVASLFFVVTLTASLWLGFFSLMYFANEPVTASWWAAAGHAMIPLIGAAGYHFTATFLQRYHRSRRQVHLFWLIATALALIGGFGSWIEQIDRQPWGFYPRLAWSSVPLVLWLAFSLTLCLRLLLGALRSSTDPAIRLRVQGILLAFGIGAFALLDFLPSYGLDVYPIGYLPALTFAFAGAWTLREHRVVSITPAVAAAEILETMQGGVMLTDLSGKIRLVNRTFSRMLGYADDELVGRAMNEVVRSPLEGEAKISLERSSWSVRDREMIWRARDGQQVNVSVSASVVRDQRGSPAGLVYVAVDITGRKQMENALRESESRYRLLFERNLAGVYRSTLDGRMLDCNDACARILGYESRDQLLERSSLDPFFQQSRATMFEQLLNQRALTNQEISFRRPDGGISWILENATLLDDEGGAPTIVEGTFIDITDRKLAEQQMEFEALHDPLTALPNRRLFIDRLDVALTHAKRSGLHAAVMFLDLDYFKSINDTRGHAVGDALLRAVARRLTAAVRDSDTVSRFGGDEFTLLISGFGDPVIVAQIAQKVLESITAVMDVEGEELRVTTSIGIAIYPIHGADAESLLERADAAMYEAKQRGRNGWHISSVTPLPQRISKVEN